MLASYAANGTGTVRGAKDDDKEMQIAFWQRAAEEGFTDDAARAWGRKFRAGFDALDERLAQQRYLMGADLSVLDIAWFIYAHRLSLAGYPFARLHPRVNAFLETLRLRPEFAKEIATTAEFDRRLDATRKAQLQAGKTLEMVAGL